MKLSKWALLIFLLVSVVFSQVNHTGWPLELLSWNVDKAYPGIEYNYRLGIKGGEYPYRFALRHGPTGMTCDTITGEIKWVPSGATVDSVRVSVRDMLGDSLVVEYVITATTTGFYFVDSANGNNANDGSEESPWATLTYASTTADSSSYVYVKKGTYNEAFPISATNCGRFLAYPGHTVTVVGTGDDSGIGITGGRNRLFQGFIFDANNRKRFFSVQGNSQNIIWRKNEMKNAYDTTSENPACIFFADQATQYKNMVIQDNVFHAVRDPKIHHGASVTTYKMINSLFEHNHVYDIDGRGFNEKVGGRRNTIRSNVFHGIYNYPAIILNSNTSSDSTEICYNHIYDCPIGVGIQIGANGNYVANIFVHHNTVIGNIRLQSATINSDTCTNINIYKNIIGIGANFPYIVGSPGNNLYPNGFRSKVLIDSNIVYGRADSTLVAGYDWGITNCNWAQWQDSGKDNNSLYMQLTYDADSIPILSDSLLAIYGSRSLGLVDTTTPIDTSPPVDTNNLSLRYRVITNASLISESDTTFVYQIDLADSISSIDAAIDSARQISITNSTGANLKRVAHYVNGTSCSVYWIGRKRASQADTFYIEFGAVTDDSTQTFTTDSITDYYSFENITADSVKNDASGLKRRQYGMTSADTIFGSGVAVPAYSRLLIPGSAFSAKTKFTINMYAAFTSFESSRYLFEMNSGTNSVRMSRGTNGKYYLNIGTDSWYGSVSGQSIDVNTPYMYTIVYNGSGTTNYDKLKLYINNDTATISYTGNVDAQMPDFSTATFTFSSESYATTGVIDEAMISSDSKSSGWVVDRYNMISNDQFYSVETAPESEPSPPIIAVQPRDTTVNDGQSAPFTITATNATGYQWYGNGELIPGATNTSYAFTATLAHNNSKIYCRVTNTTDTVWSDTATLTVNALPKTPANITVEPVSDTVTAGQAATFFVTASGSGLVYQWYRNDSLITGATNDTFTYTARSQVGNYTDNIYCLLTTDTTISTDTVQLLVNGIVFRQSVDTLKLVCSNNQNVESWQWYKNNVAISGATDSVLSVVVDSTSATKSVYYCEISNGAENKKVGDWTIERKANGRTVSRKNKYKSK